MLKLKLQYFGHLMGRADSLRKILTLGKIEDKRRRGLQRMTWLKNIIDSKDMNLNTLQEIVEDTEACHAAVHGVGKSWTWLSNWTTTWVILAITVKRLFEKLEVQGIWLQVRKMKQEKTWSHLFAHNTQTIKKAEHWRIDAFKLWCWRRLISPLDGKEIKPLNPKRNQSWIFIGRTDAEADFQYLATWCEELTHWKRPDARKDWGQEKGVIEDEMVGWHHWLNGHEFEQTPGASQGQGHMLYCCSWSYKESDTTEWLNHTDTHKYTYMHVHTIWKLIFRF